MDQELKAYLDERFNRVDERFNQVGERFNQFDERFNQVDERFNQVDERFTSVDERFTSLETEVRHTRVLVEKLDGNMRLIAEAVVGTHERIDRMQAETSTRLDEIQGTVLDIRRSLVPRVESLEGRVDRANRDILESVRKLVVPRQAQQPR